jgi:hypothetical protein
MINLTRDEVYKLLDVLVAGADAQQWELENHITQHGEWYSPERIAFMKEYIEKSDQSITFLKNKIDEPWVKTYSGGKPNYTQPIESVDETLRARGTYSGNNP